MSTPQSLPSAGELSAEITRLDEHLAVVTVAGEVDLATIAHLRAPLEQVLAGRTAALVVDMTGVRFLGSVGLNELVGLNTRCIVEGGRMWVVPSRVVRRVVELCGLTPLLPLCEPSDVDKLIASAHADTPRPRRRMTAPS